jgi:(5-formylfuran-3-yl)methyl phosphate synthase
MSELLISVRSPQEARAALAGGASLIDVKNPARGSMGRAPDAMIAAIIRAVAGRRPVSAAMGELVEGRPCFNSAGLSFVKWGLAGCGGRARWRRKWANALGQLREANSACQAVAVAYGDWRRAESPPPEQVLERACNHACKTLLLDTWCKDGTTLLDWLAPKQIERICRSCRRAGVRVALAGSLGGAHIRRLGACRPDWFAVRGAACSGGRREQAIDAESVRLLADLVKQNY